MIEDSIPKGVRPDSIPTFRGVRRWHFWQCFQGDDREQKAREAIDHLESHGFKVKVWTPRPEHKTTGHIHIVFLCNPEELWKLIGV